MWDIFDCLENIRRELKLEREDLYLISKYEGELVERAFSNSIENKYIDICLDYMDYFTFGDLMSQNLKTIYSSVKKEKEIRNKRVKALREKQKKIMQEIEIYSTVSKEEFYRIYLLFHSFIEKDLLNILRKDNSSFISIYLKNKKTVYLNRRIKDYIDKEMLEFIDFYINLRFWKEERKIEEAYLLYELEKEEKKLAQRV